MRLLARARTRARATARTHARAAPIDPRRPILVLAVLPLTAVLLARCGVLDARLEARTACVTVPDHVVPGAAGATEVSTELALDLGSALPLTGRGVSYRLFLRDITVENAGTRSDLGGIETVAVSALAPAGSPLPDPELARWDGTSGEAASWSLTAPATGETDLAPYAADGWLRLRATARGSLPPEPWVATLTACFRLEVDVRYGENL
jgi:hypothetical protein